MTLVHDMVTVQYLGQGDGLCVSLCVVHTGHQHTAHTHIIHISPWPVCGVSTRSAVLSDLKSSSITWLTPDLLSTLPRSTSFRRILIEIFTQPH